MTTIIVTHEDNEIDEFAFDANDRVITIGRRSTNDVCIPNLSVSGMHARIIIDANGALIEDNNSTNGTYVNGRLISRQLLNERDEIVIGKTRVVVYADDNNAKDNMQSSSGQNSKKQNEYDEPPTLQARNDDRIEQTGFNDDLITDADYDEADDSYVGEPSPARSREHFDDQPMSLSEKAKLALGREGGRDGGSRDTNRDAGRDNRAGTNAAGVATGAVASSAAAAASRAFASESDTAVAEAPVSVEAPAPAESLSTQSPARADAHPLDGIDDDHMAADSSVVEHDAKSNTASAEHNEASPVMKSASAVIEIQNGAKSGQVLPIDKPVTTLGRPGIQIAAIMRKPDGYFLMHIESDDSVEMPTLNRDTIGDDPVMLNSGDRLNVAGIDVEFMLS